MLKKAGAQLDFLEGDFERYSDIFVQEFTAIGLNFAILAMAGVEKVYRTKIPVHRVSESTQVKLFVCKFQESFSNRSSSNVNKNDTLRGNRLLEDGRFRTALAVA